MASGVAVSDQVVQIYDAIKLGHKHKYFIMKISDDNTEVEVVKTAETTATWDDFIGDLPENDCRYGVFDFDYKTKDGGQRNKLIFVVWAPDTAKIKKKMLVASSKDAVRKKLVGINTEIQATDADETEYDEVLSKVSQYD
ncbi:cofilin [Sphaeroforma arctica JP610]|uniref:Cofilin n=1 Tax=Sphaeroforma arctica JP610 TaxID=667725 RepID=A0A0L0FWI4_9EUKA|nr:cofilin [Sphaeroforma arctica JP610]KNC81177.1 cofilin [Sphaeroforma arctica JP610]|eukprot:XP_014155079.1 cofilin [Sphaeroforma arctica JP610]